MQGGVQPHKGEAQVPIQVAGHGGPGRWRLAFEPVDNVAALPAHGGDRPDLAGGAQLTGVAGLSAAARIEGRAVQRDPIRPNGYDDGLEIAQVAVGVEQRLGCHVTPKQRKDPSPTGRVK